MLRSVVSGRQARGCRGAIATLAKILVVVRYSPVCRPALELAARLASGLGGELIILALIPIGVRATGTRGVCMDDRRSVEMDDLDVFVKDVLGKRPTVPYEPIVAFALSAHQHVAEITAAQKPDLMVVGDPRGRVRRRLLGGFADRIRATATCPVVVVNRDTRSSLFTTSRRLGPAILRPLSAQRASSGPDSSSPPKW
jgi:nucleotide-binding universal stress UspA family protein